MSLVASSMSIKSAQQHKGLLHYPKVNLHFPCCPSAIPIWLAILLLCPAALADPPFLAMLEKFLAYS